MNKQELLFSSVIDDFMLQQRYQVKESTYAHYSNLVEAHIRPTLGEIPVNDLSSVIFEIYSSEKLRNGKINKQGGLSPKSVKDLLALIRLIVKYGVTKGIIDQKVLIFSAPRVQRKDVQVFSRQEQQRLEKFILDSNDPMCLGIYLCLYTGLRLGEICALTWADINLEDGYLNINKTVIRIKNIENTGTKTKLLLDVPKTAASKRKIPLSLSLETCLKELKKEVIFESAFFLSGTDKLTEPRCYYNKYKHYLTQCGLPSYTFHALRHTFATRCIEKGVDPKSLSEILGHADVKLTLDRYVHPSLEHKRSCMELLFS